MRKWLLIAFIASLSCTVHPAEKITFSQVVIWGHPLHSHTHSYIHWALFRAFILLGYKTLWIVDETKIDSISFDHSLFITEGQVDQNIPLRDDSYYILHNCKLEKYADLIAKKRCIIWQVYTHDCMTRDLRELADFIHIDLKKNIIYMPWATDLLPSEIDIIKKSIAQQAQIFRHEEIGWVGSISVDPPHDNVQELIAFAKAGDSAGFRFNFGRNLSMNENIKLVQSCLIAPAIQGAWQVKRGYIPCRIFKNISYGQFGVTNSDTVAKLFNYKIVYNPDCHQLFFDARDRIKTLTREDLFEQMDFVRDHHTYVNRIEYLLNFLTMIQD